MILHTKNEHINVNEEVERNIVTKNTRYKLRKLAAALSVAGSIFLLSSCGNNFASAPLTDPVTISDEVNNLDIDETLKNEFNSSYRFYYHFSKSDEEDVRTTARVEYIDVSRDLEHQIKLLFKDIIKKITNCDGEIFFKQDSADATIYISGDVFVDQKNMPKEFIDLIQELMSIEYYKGDGTNKAWVKEADNYTKKTNKIIELINQINDTEYEYKNNKIVQVQKTH